MVDFEGKKILTSSTIRAIIRFIPGYGRTGSAMKSTHLSAAESRCVEMWRLYAPERPRIYAKDQRSRVETNHVAMW